MIYVEHGALCALGQHVLALGQGTVDFHFSIGQWERTHIRYALHPEAFLLRDIVVGIAQVSECFLVSGLQSLIFLLKVFQNVTHTQSRTAGFLAVGRSDALARGAHLILSLSGLVSTVQHTMGRQDEMSPATDVETTAQVVACCLQFACLLHEQVWGNDTSVADDVHLVLGKDA